MTKQLQAEIKQSIPFRSLRTEAVLNLERTADAFRGATAEVLKPHGISGTQYNVLRILRGAGKQGRTCGEIGERLVTRDPDITRLLDRLEKRGLIARSREQKDRRVVTTRITAAGLRLLETLDGPLNELEGRLFPGFSDAKLRSLVDLLEQARNGTK
jgi:MarR family transcriptional regulator, organic hydroperoxide resistance regulator